MFSYKQYFTPVLFQTRDKVLMSFADFRWHQNNEALEQHYSDSDLWKICLNKFIFSSNQNQEYDNLMQ